MDGWPEITEPLLRERQAMSDEEYVSYMVGLLEALGTREMDDERYARAVAYPWERPPGSCLVTDAGVEKLADLDAGRRGAVVEEYAGERSDRIPLLAYGANGSPERLAQKLAHLPDGHREALIVAGDLEGFDVGAAAAPPVFVTMPATLIPSPGTAVRVAVLFLTPVQFTALWWTELSYKVGALTGITLTTDVTERRLERVILFVSRFGAFCVGGELVAMAALAATNRSWTALAQVEILEAAAGISVGEGATVRELLERSMEDPVGLWAGCYESFRAASVPFASEHWAEMPATDR